MSFLTITLLRIGSENTIPSFHDVSNFCSAQKSQKTGNGQHDDQNTGADDQLCNANPKNLRQRTMRQGKGAKLADGNFS